LRSCINFAQLLSAVESLNANSAIHGILVQLPLPEHIFEPAITSAVSPFKDVDGFQSINVGELAKRRGNPYFVPCTPKGIMALLEQSKVDVKGKRAVVLGRSNIVGKPVSYLLERADATVTVCHSRTPDLKQIVSSNGSADLANHVYRYRKQIFLLSQLAYQNT
jgi:methylenetetrahydrofolate dehydrogenase (NADP+) / methenyltetrahydrofolate cyclohydrolase / formyltetrahydrofolate synthetase